MQNKFDEFWEAYPKRTPHANPKKPARKAFERAVKNGVDPNDMIAGALGYAEYCEMHGVNPKYRCMASTFINQERHEDFRGQASITMEDILGTN